MVLFALSMDALLHGRHWKVVGHDAAAPPAVTAEYKVATAPGEFVVEDARGAVLRRADDADVASLSYRTVVAPIRLQRAFEALHGDGEWRPEYDELRV